MPTILDNLLSQGRIPPLAALFVGNGDDRFQDFQSTQTFTTSLSSELMPWVRANMHLLADARRTIVTGYSAAGLEAAYVAYAHPELFGNVLSQSGAFWRGFEGQGASEWPRTPVSCTHVRERQRSRRVQFPCGVIQACRIGNRAVWQRTQVGRPLAGDELHGDIRLLLAYRPRPDANLDIHVQRVQEPFQTLLAEARQLASHQVGHVRRRNREHCRRRGAASTVCL